MIGLVNPKCIGLIGPGVVAHIPSFFAELDALQTQGKCFPRLFDEVSDIQYRFGLHQSVIHL